MCEICSMLTMKTTKRRHWFCSGVFIVKFERTEHVLIRLFEDWRKKLDKNNAEDAVLTDLSKTFFCIPHDLLVAKLDAYGLNT